MRLHCFSQLIFLQEVSILVTAASIPIQKNNNFNNDCSVEKSHFIGYQNFFPTKSPGREAADNLNAVPACPDTLLPPDEYPIKRICDKKLNKFVSVCGCNPDHYLEQLPK